MRCGFRFGTEGAKCWLKVFNELRNRGLSDLLIAVVDGLHGFPDATQPSIRRPSQTCRPFDPQFTVLPTGKSANLWPPRSGPFTRPPIATRLKPLWMILKRV